MTVFKKAAMILFALMVAMAIAPALRADSYNKKTTVTFSQPVEVPGVGTHILPAGTYVFKVVDSLSTRDIIQVFSKDERHVYATIITLPNYRLKAANETVMTFRERPANQPAALRAWFYPGNRVGQEFVYPKTRAAMIAKEVQESVLTMPSELAEALEPPSAEAPPAAPPETLKEAPLKAIEPSGEEVEIAQVIPPPALPKTASSLPMIGLAGLLSLSVGAALLGARLLVARLSSRMS